MENKEEKLIGTRGSIFTLLLTGVFFLFIQNVLRSHVHMEIGPKNAIAIFSALPLTGVFWFASNMFYITFVDHVRNKKRNQ
tara:strand:+ start:1167 stop:1409 length:243 start_codon:yes stop_codon:yes gene_type:complete